MTSSDMIQMRRIDLVSTAMIKNTTQHLAYGWSCATICRLHGFYKQSLRISWIVDNFAIIFRRSSTHDTRSPLVISKDRRFFSKIPDI